MPEPRTKTVNFERDLVCVEYKTNHGAPIFHATTRDYKSDLLIKVINLNDDLVGCIPCDKVLVTKYFDQIGSKFKVTSGTIWNQRGTLYKTAPHIRPEIGKVSSYSSKRVKCTQLYSFSSKNVYSPTLLHSLSALTCLLTTFVKVVK